MHSPPSDNEHLLSVLEAHGKNFLQSFQLSDSHPPGKRKLTKTAELPSPKRTRLPEVESDSGEEWRGIQRSELEWSDESNGSDVDTGSDLSEYEQEDDGSTAGGLGTACSKTVVFPEMKYTHDNVSKAQKKAFMSPKVSKLRNHNLNTQQGKKKAAEEEEDELTNAQNDALLHKLVHSQILSGSLNPDLDITPKHRRKALAGRVMELAGEAKLGKGEKLLREAEKNKAGKRVREGLTRKQEERDKQELDEAKNLGNYHPTLKKLFRASGVSTARSKSRGLKLGVGKFRGGVLQLSRQDIASVTKGSQRPGGKQGWRKNK